MSINRELSQLASFLDVQESNNFIGISTGGTYTVGIGTSSVTISSNGTITATQFDGPTGSSLIDHIDLQDEGSIVGSGFTTLNFVGAAVTVTQGVSGVATITVDSAAVSGDDGAVQFASSGSLIGISTLLFADSTNHRVGIGSSSPTAKLDVDGTVNVTGLSTFSNHVTLTDNKHLQIGDNNELEFYHNGITGESLIQESGGGNFLIKGTNLHLQSTTGEDYFVGTYNGSVELYYDDSRKFETTGAGVTVYGTTETQQLNVSGVSTFQDNVDLGDDDRLRFGSNQELEIYYNTGNGNSIIQENGSSGNLVLNADNLIIRNSAANENKAKFVSNGSAILYHNAIEKFRTTGIGVSIVGTGNTATITGPSELVLDPAAVGDVTGKVIIFGDLQVDGTTTEINSTTLTVDDKSIVLASNAADSAAANGAGIEVDGASATFQYAHTGTKWVANKDLQAEAFIKNGGTSSQFLKADGSVDSSTYLTSADGGDAATLDTLDSTQFLRSDAADIKTSGDLRFDDSVKASFGTDDDLKIYSNNVHSYISNYSGQLYIDQEVDSGYINIRNDNGSGSLTDYIVAHGGTGEVRLYHFGTQKLATKSNGIDVTGHTETDTLNVSGIATAQDFNSASDENLKTNIRTIEDPLAKVVQIRGVNFDWKESQRPSLGVIAQEIEKVLPELVTDNGTKTVNYNGLIGLLIETVKEQQKQIDTLSERLSKLE